MKKIWNTLGLAGLFFWVAWSITRKVHRAFNRNAMADWVAWLRRPGVHSLRREDGAILFSEAFFGKETLFAVRPFTSDIRVLRQVFIDNEYSQVIDLSKSARLDIKYIVDCGANIGATTLYLKKHFEHAYVIAVEPDAGNFSCLERSIWLNNLSHVFTEKKGIWYRPARLEISTGFRSGENWAFEVTESPSGKIEAVSINDLIAKYNWPHVDILKIDIEGTERYLIADGREAFSDLLGMTKILAIEIHEEYNIYEAFFTFLSDHNFIVTFAKETLFGVNKKFLQ